MRYPAILAAITLIVLFAGIVAPASAQFTPNNNPAAGSSQDGSYVFVLQLDDKDIQDLRNGQPLLAKVPQDLRNKVTEVRLEYIRNNNVSTVPPANPNGVSTGQQFGPQIPDWNRNPNNTFPQANPATNFPPSTQPIGTNGGLTPLAPRNEQIPAWTAPVNNNFNPATGQGTGNQPNSGTPENSSVPQFRPTNESYNQGQPGTNQVDTAQRTPGYNNYQQNPNTNPTLLPITPNRNTYDANNIAQRNNFAQQQQYEEMIGSLRQQIDQLQRQNSGTGQRSDSLIAGHQFPLANSYPDQTTTGFGQRGLLASVRGNAGFTDQLPAASIPGSATGEPAVGQLRESASLTAGIEDANRKNAFLFFWLMCSIGLNIYLGWISRGFYVRYRELADELRETFSTV